MNDSLSIKIISPKLPVKATNGAAGYDLYVNLQPYEKTTFILQPGERRLFKTGVFMEIPVGVYGRIAPRSGLAYKQGIDVLAGVIDPDYRGEIGVILYNTCNSTPAVLDLTKPIAQIIFEKYYESNFIETTDLSSSERGEGGYGHTDNKK